MRRSLVSIPRNWKTGLDVATSLVMIAAASTLIWFKVSENRRPSSADLAVPSDPYSIQDAALKGSTAAPAVMVVFSDFECPYCGAFARDVLPQLDRDYIESGRVQLAYQYLPLPKHRHAFGAARAAECARHQNKFWPMHDLLFNDGAQLDGASLRQLSVSLQLDDEQYATCLNTDASSAAVALDVEQAKTLGVTSTPAFLLGSRMRDGRIRVSRAFYGARSLHEFTFELDRILKAHGTNWFERLSGFRW